MPLLILSILICHLVHAQKEGCNWVFGSSAFIDFNTTKPVASVKIGMNATY